VLVLVCATRQRVVKLYRVSAVLFFRDHFESMLHVGDLSRLSETKVKAWVIGLLLFVFAQYDKNNDAV